ncbi:molybdenum cofactor guanylyltransferase MobA [Paracoccus benzoatiresistens]|uniref:Molybdenum cofactor guanylyltransferase n=1 Tax=Paracoccus benzoatiresistens TaxID=2997341 RepID=A0ABT4J0G7_9RHOB|nr:molybdenum cofactor guanylyltransferase MobA [Paracoccus sp. EF6]MCZ0960610.1 molybdenum cofactor guanylyltransferase MobA [Paracoccus sp. EF6]
MTLPPAIILAGGRATRMGGGDKCLLDLDGRPMLAGIIARLSPQCAPLALNANGDPGRFAGFGLPVLPDSLPDFPGPLAGILAGMDWAASLGAGAVISVAGDTPFFPRDLAERLGAQGGGIVLAASRDGGGRVTDHPTFGQWPVALRDELRAFLVSGQRRVRGFAMAHSATLAVWDTGAVDPFFNINTPGDLERARGLGTAGGPSR